MTSNPTIEPFQTALYASQIDPQIRTLYQEMIDSLRRYGGTQYACAFTLSGIRESRYGSWGHLEEIDQNPALQAAPKYQVLLDNFRAGQGTCSSAVIPVELMDFKALCTNDAQINIKWATASASNVLQYEIQNGLDGKNWTTVKTVLPKGDKGPPQYYNTFLDNDLGKNKNIYYRLKTQAVDGEVSFSKTIALTCQNTEGGKIRVYPNPVSTVLTVENAEGQTFEVFNALGQHVLSGTIQSSMLETNLLPSGCYFLKIKQKETFQTIRFFKN